MIKYVLTMSLFLSPIAFAEDQADPIQMELPKDTERTAENGWVQFPMNGTIELRARGETKGSYYDYLKAIKVQDADVAEKILKLTQFDLRDITFKPRVHVFNQMIGTEEVTIYEFSLICGLFYKGGLNINDTLNSRSHMQVIIKENKVLKVVVKNYYDSVTAFARLAVFGALLGTADQGVVDSYSKKMLKVVVPIMLTKFFMVPENMSKLEEIAKGFKVVESVEELDMVD